MNTTDTPLTDALVVLPSGYDNNVVYHQDLVWLARSLERKTAKINGWFDDTAYKLDIATKLLTRARNGPGVTMPLVAQGGSGVVIAGGLGYRLRHLLLQSGFAARFCAKGRFAGLMAQIPVKLITHPQPGLFGAAAAFLAEHGA